MLELIHVTRIFMQNTTTRLCLMAAVTLATAWAQGGFNGPGRYEITNVRSGKVIDLDRRTQTDVIQFSSRNTDNQQWDIVPAEPGFFFFRNAMNGAALEAIDMRNSTPVRGSAFTGGPSQQWRISPGRDGNALITNRLGKTLDIPNGSTREGVRIQIYEVNGDDNQRFVFRRVGDLVRPPDRRDRDDDDWDRDRRWQRYYGRFDDRERRWVMDGDGVCFYRDEMFRGRAFCVAAGDQVRRLPGELSERFRSLKLFGRVRGVEFFSEGEFGGRRFRFERDQPELRGMRHVESVRVY